MKERRKEEMIKRRGKEGGGGGVFLGIFGYHWVFLRILGILSTFYWTLVIGSECNFFWDRRNVV